MRSKGKNPFPGVSRTVDRHGKVRWRFRIKGRPNSYLPGDYGSVEFRAAYEQAARAGDAAPVASRFKHGTFDWLIDQYYRTPVWQKLAAITKSNLRGEIERFRTDHGSRRVADLRPVHVEAVIAKKSDTPSAANKLLKLLRRLSRFAVRKELISVDPTIGTARYAENPDGYHMWTDLEIEQFEDFHGIDSKAVLCVAADAMYWRCSAGCRSPRMAKHQRGAHRLPSRQDRRRCRSAYS